MRLRYTVFALCVAAIVASVPLFAEGTGTQSAHWTYGAVFSNQNGKRQYLGLVSQPDLPAKTSPQTNSTRNTSTPYDYEIWLVRPGATQTLWYHSRQETFGLLNSPHQENSYVDNQHKLRSLVKSARPAKPLALPDNSSVAHSIGISPPDSLKEMISKSDYIVTASVIGILWNERVPIGSPNIYQHTVYLLSVESSIGSQQSPVLLKLSQVGGTQPAKEENASKSGGLSMAEDPLLTIGQRYLLFLRTMDDPLHFFKRLGYVQGASGGLTGKIADLDEYLCVNPLMGKIGLKDGKTTPVDSAQDLQFREGPQIFNLSEAEAVALIQSLLKP